MSVPAKKSRAKSSSAIRRMIITGLLMALTVVLGTTPLGLIPIGPVSITTMHIPVLIGVLIEGPLVGLVVGCTFGAFSCIRAFAPATPMDVLFQNPLVSVVPRIIFPVIAYGVAKLMNRIVKSETRGFVGWYGGAPRNATVFTLGVSAGVATLAHTVLVLGSIWLLYARQVTELFSLPSQNAVFGALAAIVATNGLPECALSIALVLAICKPLLLLKRNG